MTTKARIVTTVQKWTVNPLFRVLVRALGTDMLTVRIDLDER